LNLFQSFYVKPAANELVETTVHIQPDPRPALLGTVLSGKKPVQDALDLFGSLIDEMETLTLD